MREFIVLLFYRKRKATHHFRNIRPYVTFSFLFYIPAVAAAGEVPVLGMLMLPKTICYMFLIRVFWKWKDPGTPKNPVTP